MKTTTLIIPVANCASQLTHLLTDLKRQSYRDFEVIFIDHHSCDQTPQQLRAFQRLSGIPCQIIDVRRQQTLWDSFNHGLPYAHGDAVMFLTPETRLHAFHLERLVALDSPIAGFHSWPVTLTGHPALLNAFLTQQLPPTVIGTRFNRSSLAGLTFDSKLGSLAPSWLFYQALRRSDQATFIVPPMAPMTNPTTITVLPQYRETLNYLGQLQHDLETTAPALLSAVWHHHHYQLSSVYQQIRRLPFNSRQLYSEELRQLKMTIRQIEQDKLAFSQPYRFRSWVNRRFNNHVVTYATHTSTVS